MNNLPEAVQQRLRELGILASAYIDNDKYIVVVIITGPYKALLALYETATDKCILSEEVPVSMEVAASDEDIFRWTEICSTAINKYEGKADGITTENYIETHTLGGGPQDHVRFSTAITRGAPRKGAGKDHGVAEEDQPPPG